MTDILIYSVVFVSGVTVGYVAHIVKTNCWLIKKGISPKDFLNE